MIRLTLPLRTVGQGTAEGRPDPGAKSYAEIKPDPVPKSYGAKNPAEHGPYKSAYPYA